MKLVIEEIRVHEVQVAAPQHVSVDLLGQDKEQRVEIDRVVRRLVKVAWVDFFDDIRPTQLFGFDSDREVFLEQGKLLGHLSKSL